MSQVNTSQGCTLHSLSSAPGGALAQALPCLPSRRSEDVHCTVRLVVPPPHVEVQAFQEPYVHCAVPQVASLYVRKECLVIWASKDTSLHQHISLSAMPRLADALELQLLAT